ncbi:hypothetical protein BDN72DRAFT_896656 [Pluteus cervinus]|uniref:Uncharacterized protein n=1 Tax=Pluteus cervinus TaxID=181527 RepID=A0ACD3AX35_9AGAR|nr:hypothetical protein BDN72DRAFT_896656 [Pluteus cervinus]
MKPTGIVDSELVPLDDTRIHPEDYELARKMAISTLELDKEDIHDEHPSLVVLAFMHDPENEKKLAELNLKKLPSNTENLSDFQAPIGTS